MKTRSADRAPAKADQFIRKNFKSMSNVELGDALWLSPHTVRRKMAELGLKRSRPPTGTSSKQAAARTMAAKTKVAGSARKQKPGARGASSKKPGGVRSGERSKAGGNVDAFIRKSFKRMNNAEIGVALGLSEHTIRRKMTELGLKRPLLKPTPKRDSVSGVKPARKANAARAVVENRPAKPKAKAPDANAFIRKSFKRMSNAEIGAALGLSEHTIRRKMTELGLKRPSLNPPPKKDPLPQLKQARKAKAAGAVAKNRSSNPKAKAPNANTFIRKNFKRMSNAEIGAALGLSPHTIRRKMTELGLKRPQR